MASVEQHDERVLAYEWLNRDVFVATGARYARAIELWFHRVT